MPCILALASGPGAAQERGPLFVGNEVFAGSEFESYLRVMQVRGDVPLHPWSVRGFSVRELNRLAPDGAVHPWAERFAFADTAAGVRLRWIAPQAQAIYNSSFPYGGNDGAVWAGRGLTTAVRAGLALRAGPVSLTLAPVAFRAENRSFELRPNGGTGAMAFADPAFPGSIDLPQRFGNGAYTRIDPGQSALRVDLAGVTVGLSTANQYWGPAREHPLLLGNNAPGFPHVFVGTSTPLDVWLGHVHGRLTWGGLSHTEYARVPASGKRRRMAGLVGVFQPRGISGLELGAARFFHSPGSEGRPGADFLLKPFEGLLKEGLKATQSVDGKSDADNQLASVFARWVAPRGGFEVYGEFAREDHSWNLRDLLVEPDHDSGYLLGIGKVWKASGTRWSVLRGEVLNTRITHLQKVRGQTPFYRHTAMTQGHTHRGQLLGSVAGYGGGASVLALDVYRPGGRWTARWNRELRGRLIEEGQVVERGAVHSLGAEVLFFRGALDLTASLDGLYGRDQHDGWGGLGVRLDFGMQWRP